jgi:hypothetical protein
LNSIRQAGLSPAVSDEKPEPVLAPDNPADSGSAPLESESNAEEDSAAAAPPEGLPTGEQPAEEQPAQESLEDNKPEEAGTEDEQPGQAAGPGQ